MLRWAATGTKVIWMRPGRFFNELVKQEWIRVVALVALLSAPVSSVFVYIQMRISGPLLLDDVRQIGVSAAQRLAKEIAPNILQFVGSGNDDLLESVEEIVEEILLDHPSIMRIDVFKKITSDKKVVIRAVQSTADDDQSLTLSHIPERTSYVY
jgi:hypothetical protein